MQRITGSSAASWANEMGVVRGHLSGPEAAHTIFSAGLLQCPHNFPLARFPFRVMYSLRNRPGDYESRERKP